MNKDREERINEYLVEALQSDTLFTVAEYYDMVERRFGLEAPRDPEVYRKDGRALARNCADYEYNRPRGKPNRYPEKSLAEMILKND